MMKLKRYGVLSYAIHTAVSLALVGILYGIIVAIMLLVGGGLLPPDANLPAGSRVGLAIGALIGMPIFLGISGFMSGLISAWFFNLSSKISGGVEMEFESPSLKA